VQGGAINDGSGGTLGTAGDDSTGTAGDDPTDGGESSMGGGSSTGGTPSAGGGGDDATGGLTSAGSGGKAAGGATTSGAGGKASGGTASTGGAGGKSTTGGTPSTGGTATVVPPSCTGLTAQCQSESCCTSISVPGGTFKMGRSLVATDPDYTNAQEDDETPEHSATVGAFKLDKYEVTVGRFRKFHANYRQWHVTNKNPVTNAGLHPLVGRTGWGQSWTPAATNLPADEVALATSLKCQSAQQTWTDAPTSASAPAESYPINCVSWYVAFAFCVWDGGRLPTEAEWEYVAAGGQSNFMFPWGNEPVDNTRANWQASEATPYQVVGSKPAGAGSLGHRDLSGSMREWVFDWYLRRFYGTTAAPEACVNCVNWYEATDVYYRTNRGGSWLTGIAGALRATERIDESPPSITSGSLGFRCAR
jgi:formylglycine-generating enzyme required for sulfatase activity